MDVPSRIDSGDRGQDDADEAQRGFFGLIGSRIGKQRGEAAANLHTHDALLLLRNYEESGQGWFWSTDATGRLTYLTASVARDRQRVVSGTDVADGGVPSGRRTYTKQTTKN